jgi:hypothetical protein
MDNFPIKFKNAKENKKNSIFYSQKKIITKVW